MQNAKALGENEFHALDSKKRQGTKNMRTISSVQCNLQSTQWARYTISTGRECPSALSFKLSDWFGGGDRLFFVESKQRLRRVSFFLYRLRCLLKCGESGWTLWAHITVQNDHAGLPLCELELWAWNNHQDLIKRNKRQAKVNILWARNVPSKKRVKALTNQAKEWIFSGATRGSDGARTCIVIVDTSGEIGLECLEHTLIKSWAASVSWEMRQQG